MRKISRRSFLRTTALGSAAVALGARAWSRGSGRVVKPNLLVFLPDQVRADLIIGDSANLWAPSLHALANESFIFERAYVTHPVCTPARSSLLSGTWPHQTGCTANKNVLPRSILCLPEMICDSAYRTGYLGKWHLGDEFSAQHGFQTWVSIEDSFKTANHRHKNTGLSNYSQFLISKGYRPDSHNGRCFSLEFPAKLPIELSKPKFLESQARDFLERNRRKPFVLFVAFFEPHPPYDGPLNNEYPLDQVSVDPTIDNEFADDMPLRYRLRQEFYRKECRSPFDFRRIKQRYLGLLNEVDRSVGAILAKLDDLGLRENTITVFTSDHGDMMSAHSLFGKQLMFEQSAVVPWLVRVPGESPCRFSDPVSHIDFVPTMLDLLGKSPHRQCVGRSKANVIRGDAEVSDFTFVEWAPTRSDIDVSSSTLASNKQIRNCLRESTRAVVSPDGWKLCLRDRDKNELYDLRGDPNETRNLFYQSGHRDTIAALSRRIRVWQRTVGDKLRLRA